jgi:hypothetical protein
VNSSALGSNGYTLLDDYVMGLSPVDASAMLSLGLASVSNGVQAVFSPWEGGRNYGLQGAGTVNNPGWTNIPNLSAYQNSNGAGVIAVTNLPVPQQYYRLSIQMTP